MVPSSAADPGTVVKCDTLSGPDVNAILKKLEDRHRLGVLASLSQEERRRHFALANGQLFTALSRLTEAPGFVGRIGDELRGQQLEQFEIEVLAKCQRKNFLCLF